MDVPGYPIRGTASAGTGLPRVREWAARPLGLLAVAVGYVALGFLFPVEPGGCSSSPHAPGEWRRLSPAEVDALSARA